MVGRDDPKVFTKSGIRDLIGDVESLRKAGYASGDILPIIALGSQRNRSSTTSSSSYVDIINVGEAALQWNGLLDPDNTYAAIGCRIVPDGGETGYHRWVNTLDNDEQIGPEASTDSAEQVWTGWEKYTPTTPDEPLIVQAQGKSEPATNTSTIRSPLLYIGVKL
jgi:hypothetical protein